MERYDFSSLNILGFIDKDAAKRDQKIGNYNIYCPYDLKSLNPDVVIITLRESKYTKPYLKRLFIKIILIIRLF